MCFLFLPSLCSSPFIASSPLESPQTHTSWFLASHVLVFLVTSFMFPPLHATFSFLYFVRPQHFLPLLPFSYPTICPFLLFIPPSCLSALLLLSSVLTSAALHPLGFGLIVTLLFPFIPRLLLPPICLLSFLFLPPHIRFIPPSPPCPPSSFLFFSFNALSPLRLLSCLTLPSPSFHLPLSTPSPIYLLLSSPLLTVFFFFLAEMCM